MTQSNTKRLTLKRLASIGLLGAALPLSMPAMAQSWPIKPVRMIVPFAAGGSTDVLARMLGERLQNMWGQPVVVENRAGAGGNIGGDVVAKSAADGYTLLFASGSITINPPLYGARMPFDPRKDLAPITIVADGPQLVVVETNSPYKTLKDLIDAAKSKPDSLAYGSAGVGSQVHLATENLAFASGIDIRHVPYRGEAAAYPDLMGGQIQLIVGNIAAAGALVSSGRLRAVGVTSAQRIPQFPDVPTVSESGVPGFSNIGWFGLLAPTGTPDGILNKIQADVASAMDSTMIRARLFTIGMRPVASSRAEFASTIDAELVRWGDIIKARNITVN
jgi:tripartite-type tricarboxylate transporter receptor subunit TctC